MKKGSNIDDWKLFQFFLLIGLSAGLLYPLLSYNGTMEINCPFAGHSNTPCPSCGLSSAWHYLYNGDFKAAMQANPNAYSLLLLLLSQIVWRGWLIVKATEGRPIIIWDIIITTVSIVLLAGPYFIDLINFTIGSYYSLLSLFFPAI